jgi:hypothetical protein
MPEFNYPFSLHGMVLKDPERVLLTAFLWLINEERDPENDDDDIANYID